jgi:hypothetical protein
MKTILIAGLLTFTAAAYSQSFTFEVGQLTTTQGWVKVIKDKHIGFLDQMGQEIIPADYEEIGRFGDYCNDAALAKKDGKYGLIDIDGNEIVLFDYELIGKEGEYNPGWILVKKEGLYGFIDCSGEVIAEPAYTEIPENKLKINVQANPVLGFGQ